MIRLNLCMTAADYWCFDGVAEVLMFYVLVSGKRDFDDFKSFSRVLDQSLSDVSDEIEIVEGGAQGTDALARRYAEEKKLRCREFRADWDQHGKAAGPKRNSEMVKFVAAQDSKAIFFWDGKSSGTGDCLRKANRAGIPCEVFEV